METVTMRQIDFQRRFEQVGTYTAWITAAALAATLTFDQYGSNHPMATWLYWVLIGSCAAVGLGYTAQSLVNKKSGGAGMSTTAYIIQMALSTVALTGLCAATGGIERPYWLFFVVALIPAAVCVPVGFTVFFGFAASVGVVVSSFIAGTAVANNRGALTFVCVLIPVTAWYIGVL